MCVSFSYLHLSLHLIQLHSDLPGGPTWWVRTPVLSVRNPQVPAIGLGPDCLNGLSHVRDVPVVDERAVPDGGGKHTIPKMKLR